MNIGKIYYWKYFLILMIILFPFLYVQEVNQKFSV